MDAQDTHEAIEEAKGRNNGRVALLIAALAAMLAVVDVSAGNADQEAGLRHTEATNLWAFFQAKTMRRSTTQNFSEFTELLVPDLPPERQNAYREQLRKWKETMDRWDSEPSTNEGRRELQARAQAAETARDAALRAGDFFDYASASFQLAIVLASASIVIGIAWLAYIGGLLGGVGVGLAVMGWFF